MKNLIITVFFSLLSVLAFSQEAGDSVIIDNQPIVSVDNVSEPEEVKAKVGEVKSFELISPDSAKVINDKEEEFILVSENIGGLVSTLIQGYNEVKTEVDKKPEPKPTDWIFEIIKWLLGGSLASVTAYGSRAIDGLKRITSGIARNGRLVIYISGILTAAYMYFFTELDITTIDFWLMFGASWFAVTMFAVGLYETVFKGRLFVTPKSEAVEAEKIETARALIESKGGKVVLA